MIFPARNLHLFWGFSMAMLVITRWYKPTHIPGLWCPFLRHCSGSKDEEYLAELVTTCTKKAPNWTTTVTVEGLWIGSMIFTIRHGHRWVSMWSLVVYHVPGLTLINYTTFYPTKLGDLADSSSNRVVVHTGGLPSPIWLAKKCHDPASLWAFCKSRWVV